ncbi:MAG: DUF4442 domain-containing protein [Deltaproteobacteria bacterium]|nr:MAG: DUF4442 domain-containing protein [Deltaproteobacteria bacterium]
MKILWKETLGLWFFSFTKIRAIFYTRPRVIKVSNEECEIMIPLNRKTKNHLNSMYFGVLAIGADCAGGLIAMNAIRKSGKNISLAFKDFKADFLKRPEADVHFICKEGQKTLDQIAETVRTGERVNRVVNIIATTPSISGDEPVAKFELNLSLRASA